MTRRKRKVKLLSIPYPLRRARGLEIATCASGAVAVILAAAWALWPAPAPQHDLPDLRAAPEAPADDDPVPALNLAAFGARIWNPQPDPVDRTATETKPTEQSPAPLRLQLVAIVRDGEQLRAALYDPEANELRLVRVGDAVARHTITLVDATGVEMRPPEASAGPRRLDLIPPGGPQ